MPTDASGERLSKYETIRLLGSGGMGEVYLARDTVLNRDVAIKFVSPHRLADDRAEQRLLHEARAAAALDHPSICPIHDVHVDESGRTCIVMQYVEGETLSHRLTRGPLGLDESLALARAIADALIAAHARRIVHRDLKPHNIMVTPGGRPKLLDFGIAQTHVPPAVIASAATHTDTGSGATGPMVGTPAYMSPEQVLQKPVDGRTDLFSLGAVLYECLTGQPAFLASTDVETWARVVYHNPPAPSSFDPRVPPAIDALVARLLAKDPAGRFESAADVVAALEASASAGGPPRRRWRRFAAAAAAFGAIGLTGFIAWRLTHRDTPTGVRSAAASPVIGVLPFANLSDDKSLDYVGAGMADTITTKLAGLSGLAVVSRAEVHDALQRSAETSRVCRALGLTYAVTGSVQQSGGRIHVTINVLTGDGRTVIPNGGRIYEDSTDRLFELQRRIAEDLSMQVVGRLTTTERAQLARAPTASVDALSAYWRGRALMEKPGPDPIDPAIAAFTLAVSLDRGFALGHAGLGTAYWRKYVQTREQTWASQATAAVEQARQIDPDQPEVRLALATVYIGVGRVEEAAVETQRALQLQPSSFEAHRRLGDIRSARGETADAIQEYQAAIRVRPDSPQGYRSLGIVQLDAGRYSDAVDTFRTMATLQPDSPFPFQLMGNAHAGLGDLAAAERDYSEALARGGSFATHSSLGFVYYMNGRFADAAAAFQKAIDLRPKYATTYWNLGDAYRHLERGKDATDMYRKAVALFDADLEINNQDALSIANRATCLARLGDVAKARAEVSRAARLAPGSQDVQYQRALVAVIAEDRGEAIDALKAAVAAGYSTKLLQVDPDIMSLRGDGVFQSLVDDRQSMRRTK